MWGLTSALVDLRLPLDTINYRYSSLNSYKNKAKQVQSLHQRWVAYFACFYVNVGCRPV